MVLFCVSRNWNVFKEVHADNASLALQLARFFLTRAPPTGEANPSPIMDTCKGFQLEWREAVGLRLVNWPGRSQTVRQDSKLFFLDGAHTEQSMWACRKWFLTLQEKYPIADSTKRILLFNSTGDRNSEILLSPLITMPFDHVIFCTNETKKADMASDNTNLNFSFDFAMKKCEINKMTWDTMKKRLVISKNNGGGDDVSSRFIPHIEDALNLIDDLSQGYRSTQIFVTGSLHLIGGVLRWVIHEAFNTAKHTECYEKKIRLFGWFHKKYLFLVGYKTTQALR